MRRGVSLAITTALLGLLVGCGRAPQAPPPAPAPPTVDGTTPVVFLDADAAGEFLSTPDDYLERLNLFNMQLRLGTDEIVSPEEFAAFAGEQAREWAPAEQERLTRILARYEDKLASYGLEWPEEVRLIKTTGAEEFEAAYTRGNAIILPEAVLRLDDGAVAAFVLHELFHIYSRHATPARRDDLYAVIGFQPTTWSPPLLEPFVANLEPEEWPRLDRRRDIPLPYPIVDSAIVNPDAFHRQHVIPVTIGVREVFAVPVLFSREDDPVAAAEMGLENIMGLRLLIVAPDELGSWDMDREMHQRREAFAVLDQVHGFWQKIGRNTDYVIHPEEVLADNFALLILDQKDLPSPEILEKLDAALRNKESAP
ncbi:MAG: hypothetical protein AAGK14_07025 [Verrucomicrobiota bacterium]